MGKIEMSSTQIRAGEILLRKVLPDLKAVEVTSESVFKPIQSLTDEELMVIAASGRNKRLKQVVGE